MHKIKALCFDVFGTVVDWRSGVAREARAFLQHHRRPDIDAFEFADHWRGLYQPAMEACRTQVRPYTRLDVLHRENLDRVLESYGFEPAGMSAAELTEFSQAWRRLDPWPDAKQGLERLKRRFLIAPLSNGNLALMAAMAKRSGLPWDLILGAEVTREYKPAPGAYLRAVDILGLQADEVCMVAAHNDDLAAARRCGLATAFVLRPTEHGPSQTTDLGAEEAWDVVAQDLNELAARLDC
jgi:2-haloacid dehalogenase